MIIIKYYPEFGATVNDDSTTFVGAFQTMSAIIEAGTVAYFQIQNIEKNAYIRNDYIQTLILLHLICL